MIEDLRHARHAIRCLEDSLTQWIKRGEQFKTSLKVTGEQLDKLINKHTDE